MRAGRPRGSNFAFPRYSGHRVYAAADCCSIIVAPSSAGLRYPIEECQHSRLYHTSMYSNEHASRVSEQLSSQRGAQASFHSRKEPLSSGVDCSRYFGYKLDHHCAIVFPSTVVNGAPATRVMKYDRWNHPGYSSIPRASQVSVLRRRCTANG